MAAMYNQILIGYRDINGKQWTSFWPALDQSVGPAGELADVAAAMQAVSYCGVMAVQFQSTLIIGNTPTDGAYPSGTDRCNILAKFPDTNKPFTFGIPGPKEEIFRADRLTLDLSNTDVINLQDQMDAVVGDLSGHALGLFKRGRRSQAKGDE